MCDPATLTLVIGGISAAASIAGGIGGMQQANANAKAATAQSRYEADRSREEARRLLARQRVGFLSAGLQLSGTPVDVLADTAAQAEMDALAIRWSGAQRAAAFEAQGQSALIGGIAGAAQPLLTGYTSWADQTGGIGNYARTTGQLGTIPGIR